jgi:hypothetical protein
MGLYDDPNFQPPADIEGAEARAYEEKIVEMLREHLLPSPGPTLFLKSIELRGQRPQTEIIFRYTKRDRPGNFAGRVQPWKEEWPTSGAAEYFNTLNSAADVGSTAFIAWMSGDLES